MTQPTVLMLGVGDYDKHSDFTPLFEAFGSTVKGVIASGINIPAIKAAAEKTGYKGEFVEWYGNFEGMIKKAGEMAGKEARCCFRLRLQAGASSTTTNREARYSRIS